METAVDRNNKEVASLGVPWERAFGYAQAVRVKNTIYVTRLAFPQQLIEISFTAVLPD